MARDPMVRHVRWVLSAWIVALVCIVLHVHEAEPDHDDDDDAPCSMCAVAHAPIDGPAAPALLPAPPAPVLIARSHRPEAIPARVIFRVSARGPPASV